MEDTIFPTPSTAKVFSSLRHSLLFVIPLLGIPAFLPMSPLGVQNSTYNRRNGGNPYGLLYPSNSYDISLALAALAVGEARALLQTTREFKQTTLTSNPKPDSIDNDRASRQKRPTVTRSRSDMASWRKDVTNHLPRTPRSTPHPILDLSGKVQEQQREDTH